MTTQPTRAQRWIAALFSLIGPGFGQLFRGAPVRAAVVFFLATFGSLAALMLVMKPRGIQHLLILPLLVLGLVAPAWDAYHFAESERNTYAAYARSHRYILSGLAVLSMLVIQGFVRRYASQHVMQAFRTPSGSMQPVLLLGDYILARPIHSKPGRQAIVIYRDDSSSYIKRIVGMPGDTISMKSATLFVNGHAAEETYASRPDSDRTDSLFEWQRASLLPSVDRVSYKPTLESWGPLLVPSDHFFLLGDDRGHSYDSRYTGFIDDRAVVAEPTVLYFSFDPETRRVRWSRIGNSVQ